MFKALPAFALASSLSWVSLAAAEPSAQDAAGKQASTSAAREDPHGIKGISPFWQLLNKGDAAFVARDYDLALVHYKDALTKEPQNALGYYRVGEAQLAKANPTEAEGAFTNGLRFVPASNPALKAKLLFVLAELRERQKAWDEASAKWTEYEAFSSAQKVGAPASGSERKRSVEAFKKASADSAEVKLRIQKGIAAADEAMRKSSK